MGAEYGVYEQQERPLGGLCRLKALGVSGCSVQGIFFDNPDIRC